MTPAIIYLWFATGGPPPMPGVCGGTPPAFECTFAPTVDECQRQIVAQLEEYYRPFAVQFVTTEPAHADYTVVITGHRGWCSATPSCAAGVAPSVCVNYLGGEAFALECGDDPVYCAKQAAHEHGHLVGLEHTASERDIMNPTICTDCAGFLDETLPVIQPTCRQTQNSYRLMLERLGGPGMPATDPAGCGCMCGPDQPAAEALALLFLLLLLACALREREMI